MGAMLSVSLTYKMLYSKYLGEIGNKFVCQLDIKVYLADRWMQCCLSAFRIGTWDRMGGMLSKSWTYMHLGVR